MMRGPRRAGPAAAARWPRQCGAIRACLDRLAQYEAKGSEDLDAVSGCFGELIHLHLRPDDHDWYRETGRAWRPLYTHDGTAFGADHELIVTVERTQARFYKLELDQATLELFNNLATVP